MDWYWLSYADEEGFNGVVIVEGADFLSAVNNCINKGLRPEKGGQVTGCVIDPEMFPTEYKNRLLSQEEVENFC